MKRSTRKAARRQVERMLHVQAPTARQNLPAGFTRSTMAKVRTANARMQQCAAFSADQRGFAPAAVALAGLVIIAAVTALVIQMQSRQPEPIRLGSNDTPADPPIAEILPSEREIRSLSAAIYGEAIVVPIRQEADALISTGREVGLTMLSALPARPSAWSERLSESPGR